LEVTDVDLPDFRFEVRCTKGTYVRTLVHDLGEALGCGGHLARLSRERQGNFRRAEALPWEALEGVDAAARIRGATVSPEDALAFLGELAVPAAAQPIRVGELVPLSSLPDGAEGFVRLTGAGGAPIGIGRRTEEGLRALYLFPPPPRFGRSRRAT
ncbi:hypothetical protein K8I85_06520, partial [bacterium]|nr:hypothetical protein [bacterium]